jgi:hypothetical protein
MTRRITIALAVAVGALAPHAALAADAPAAKGTPHVAPAEAKTVTKQALANTADLLDAKKVVVKSCELDGSRALCHAVIRGKRQTIQATVSIRELPDDYVVRVLSLR